MDKLDRNDLADSSLFSSPETFTVMDPSVSKVFLQKMEILLTLMIVIFAMLCILLTVLLVMVTQLYRKGRCKKTTTDCEGVESGNQQQLASSSTWCQQLRGVGRSSESWYHQLPATPAPKNTRWSTLNPGTTSPVYTLTGPSLTSNQYKLDGAFPENKTFQEPSEPVYQEIGEILQRVRNDAESGPKDKVSMTKYSLDDTKMLEEEKKGKVDMGVIKRSSVVYGLITAKEVARYVPCEQTAIVREGGVL